MARGWDSKGVEDQIAAAEARKELREREALSSSEIERRRRREGLLLELARLERERLKSHKRRYLALLDRSVKHIELELAAFDKPDSD